nr:MAG TPA: hypothetical protein [Crassvirales sp.]
MLICWDEKSSFNNFVSFSETMAIRKNILPCWIIINLSKTL